MMTDLELIQLLEQMAKYLKHKDGCCEGPDFFIDAKHLETCPCGVQQLKCFIMDKVIQLEGVI